MPAFDSLHDLRHMLDSLPNSRLFLQALQRVGYDSLMRNKDSIYTLLVPTDSLLMAMGYTRDVISYLDPGLLRSGIISSQIIYGNFSDSLLDASAYINAVSMYNPVTNLNTTYRLGKQAGPAGGLWIYGAQYSPQSGGLRASNGYLYSVNKIYVASMVNAWALLQSKPEFSYFVAACRINDSIYNALGSGYRGYPLNLANDTDIFLGTYNSTYFVPTNQAFINAGFRTIDDIRAYGSTAQYDPTQATVSPLDTIIYGHFMPDSMLFSLDLQKNPTFNQRPLAATGSGYDKYAFQSALYTISYQVDNDIYDYPNEYGQGQPLIGKIIFQSAGGVVSMSCNSSKKPPAAILVEPDMVCQYNLILHGVDHLFWPY